MTRTEFGALRSTCSCGNCQINCRFIPGFLIPADLRRMIPADVDPLTWAETNLLASPGALAVKDGRKFRIPTLVPARKTDGSCIHLSDAGRCNIHEVAPFGCAFFSCGPEVPGIAHQALVTIMRESADGLYARIWGHLKSLGKVSPTPDESRKRMTEYLNSEGKKRR